MANLKDINYGIGKYLVASDASDFPDIGTNRTNLDLLNFKVATNNAYALYNFKDGMIDAYQTSGGVDAGASTNEIRESSDKYYSGAQAGNYFGNGELGDVTFGASSITQSNDTVAIDTKLSTGSESGGPGTNSFAFSAQGPGPGQNFPWTYTTRYTPNPTATYELTVPNTSGSYDGDMTLAQFNTLTINASVTLTTKQPGRGLFIFVKGNCVINGSLCMTARGGASNPTTSGGSDINAVGSNGLQFGMLKSGSSSSFTNDGTGFNGAGTGIRTALANQTNLSSNGAVFTISRAGAAGGAGKSGNTPSSGNHGTSGTSAATILTGGGGGGSISKDGGPGSAVSGSGGQGGCFSGGPGGGSASRNWDSPGTAGNAVDYGGAAGSASAGGGSQYNNAGGSAGAPPSNNSGGTNSHNRQRGADGSGGLIWLVVGGTLTIGSGATVEAKGGNGGIANSHGNSSGGAGSAGGAIMILHYGALTNNGSISTSAGSGGSGGGAGGNGGSGGLHTSQVDQPQLYNNMTLVSNAQTAQAAPTTGRLMIYEETSTGSTTLDTDLKGYVSRDGGTTYTQTPLTLDTTYETGKTLVSGSVDISGQPSGTNMRYKIETLNQSASKVCRLHGASLLWA